MPRAAKRAALALLMLAGCTQRTVLLTADAAMPMCDGVGPPIVLAASQPCAGALAAATVTRALCSCKALQLPGGLSTDTSMDTGGVAGGGGPAPPDSLPPASVGTDDTFSPLGPVQISGSLTAASNVSIDEGSIVFGNLYVGNNLAVSGKPLDVVNDAYIAGREIVGKVSIEGTLYVTDNLDPNIMLNGDYELESFDVPPPCGCDGGPVLDMPGLIAAADASNDNGAAALDADVLATPLAPAATAVVDLYCGRYHLTSVHASAQVQLHVHGRAALFVDGDLDLPSGLFVALDAGAELDLVVGGNISVGGGTLGGAKPASTRLWLAGTSLSLAAGATIGAVVYAPLAELSGGGLVSVSGALFVKQLSTSGNVDIHYDRGVLTAGNSCGAPPVTPDL